MTGHAEKRDELAREILILSRNTLLVNLRFMDMALSQFVYHPIENNTLLTDGKYLLYDPKHILRCYKKANEIIVRDYLHVVMHCVYRHMFIGPAIDRVYWDLACDIAVENMITEMRLRTLNVDREDSQSVYLSEIKEKLNMMTAEKIYDYLRSIYSDQGVIACIRSSFCADNHEIWYMSDDEKTATYGLPEVIMGSGEYGDDDENQDDSTFLYSNASRVWESISEQIQVYLETYGKQRGMNCESMIQNLSAVNREKYDYTAFLKKFAVLGETIKINDDEFDYIFYTYGLQLYGNMPLIEPLEYKEVKRIKEFVIVIDTSGSTSGELVCKFVQKTYNILKSTESFFTKINIHIIQCDERIQEDVKITSQEEFDKYLKTMKIRGMGGTSFIPAFEYVEQLRQNKEFTNLKGMIYFTDGLGVYPSKKPDYDTAFVFLNDDYNNPDVPAWAIKLILQNNEI